MTDYLDTPAVYTDRPGYVPLPSGDCGRSLANPCGYGMPSQCGMHSYPRSSVATPEPAFVTDGGPGVEIGPGTYMSSQALPGVPPLDKPTAPIDVTRAGIPGISLPRTDDPRPINPFDAFNQVNGATPGPLVDERPPGSRYDPATVRTSHPDGAASWGQVLMWAIHADHIGAPDESGVLWCAAGERCAYRRWSRFDPNRPGDADRPVSELFAWLAEHWGCGR